MVEKAEPLDMVAAAHQANGDSRQVTHQVGRPRPKGSCLSFFAGFLHGGSPLVDYAVDDLAVYVGQAELPTLIFERQTFVVDPHEV